MGIKQTKTPNKDIYDCDLYDTLKIKIKQRNKLPLTKKSSTLRKE